MCQCEAPILLISCYPGELVPAKFFGITRRSIKPALDDSAFELEEETKTSKAGKAASIHSDNTVHEYMDKLMSSLLLQMH